MRQWIRGSWRFGRVLVAIGWGFALLTGCVTATPAPADTPAPTATPVLTETPTINWFPATATPTPIPNNDVSFATATAAPPPPSGSAILKDDFSNKKLWGTKQSANGSIAYGKNELTLAVALPKTSLSSFRDQLVLDNFLLEINVTPSLCQDTDQFGILFRVASTQDYYRYLMTCGGQLRLERLRNGEASVVQDWSPVLGLSPFPLQTYRLGVWASGSDLRFYVNNVFQFSKREPTFASGGLGLYARSLKDTIVTINFFDLQIFQVSPSAPTLVPATPTP